MSEPSVSKNPLRFRGSSNKYVDIGVRNENEFLAASVEYAIHPSNIGCFIVRFVAHGNGADPKNYKHLTFRESAKFLIPTAESIYHGEMFRGYRLDKVAIPAFKPAVQRHEVDNVAQTLGTWVALAAWIASQSEKEGFDLLLDPAGLAESLRSLVVPAATPGEITSILEFPDLSNPSQKLAAAKKAAKPAPEPEDEDVDDDEDDDSDKEWLN